MHRASTLNGSLCIEGLQSDAEGCGLSLQLAPDTMWLT